jgi:hypothetical protein
MAFNVKKFEGNCNGIIENTSRGSSNETEHATDGP